MWPHVTQAASEVSRLVHEARDLHLPVEPGAREGRDALVRWAVLLEVVIAWASNQRLTTSCPAPGCDLGRGTATHRPI